MRARVKRRDLHSVPVFVGMISSFWGNNLYFLHNSLSSLFTTIQITVIHLALWQIELYLSN